MSQNPPRIVTSTTLSASEITLRPFAATFLPGEMPAFSEKVGPKLPLSLLLNEQRVTGTPAMPQLAPIEGTRLEQASPQYVPAYAALRPHPAYANPYGLAHNYYYPNQPQHYVPYSGPYPGMPMYPGGAGMYLAPMNGVSMAYMPHPPPPLQSIMQQRPHTPQEMGQYGHPQPGTGQIQTRGPGEVQRTRRFRRRYYQIYRKYSCLFPGCLKSYGSLNHLNTHIVTKKHGARKSKADFKHTEGVSLAHAGHAATHDRQEPPEPAFDHENFHRGSPTTSVSPQQGTPLSTPLVTPLITPLVTPQLGNVPGINLGSTSQPWVSPWPMPGQPLPAFPTHAQNSTRLPLLPSIIGEKP